MGMHSRLTLKQTQHRENYNILKNITEKSEKCYNAVCMREERTKIDKGKTEETVKLVYSQVSMSAPAIFPVGPKWIRINLP